MAGHERAIQLAGAAVLLTVVLHGSRLADPSSAGAFVAGVFLASWARQLVLVLVLVLVLAGISSATGSRLPGWGRTVTSLVGYAVVTGYAVRLAAG